MNVVLTRLPATSGQLLIVQFVWTTPATLTSPAGWSLINQIDGTGLSQALYQQAGPLTQADETWALSQNQQWSAAVINFGTATLESSAHASGTGLTTAIVGPPGASLTDLAAGFYGTLGRGAIIGVQSPGAQNNSTLSAFWEYHAAYLSAINFVVTLPQSQDWVETQLVLKGSPVITPGLGTCPVSSQSGG